MIHNLYSIHDKLAEMYSAPFALNPKTAARTFAFMAKEKSEQECKDQEIIYLGIYDTDTGEIIKADQKEAVYNLEEAWRANHGN